MKIRLIILGLFILTSLGLLGQTTTSTHFRLEDRDSFTLMGKFIKNTRDPGALLMFWMEFYKTVSDVPVYNPNVDYGLYVYSDAQNPTTNQNMMYMASFEVEKPNTSSQIFACTTIPSARYAVFEHKGPVSEVLKTLKQIFDIWLPQAKLSPAKNFYFEKYDQRYKVENPDSVIEIWVPVKLL